MAYVISRWFKQHVFSPLFGEDVWCVQMGSIHQLAIYIYIYIFILHTSSQLESPLSVSMYVYMCIQHCNLQNRNTTGMDSDCSCWMLPYIICNPHFSKTPSFSSRALNGWPSHKLPTTLRLSLLAAALSNPPDTWLVSWILSTQNRYSM